MQILEVQYLRKEEIVFKKETLLLLGAILFITFLLINYSMHSIFAVNDKIECSKTAMNDIANKTFSEKINDNYCKEENIWDMH